MSAEDHFKGLWSVFGGPKAGFQARKSWTKPSGVRQEHPVCRSGLERPQTYSPRAGWPVSALLVGEDRGTDVACPKEPARSTSGLRLPPALSPAGASVVTGQTSRILSKNQDVQLPIRNRVIGRGDGVSVKRTYHGQQSERYVSENLKVIFCTHL